MKTAQDFLKEANDIVERIDTNEAIKKHGSDETIFIDVRDSADIKKTGTIKDCLTIPRGLNLSFGLMSALDILLK